MEQDAERAKRTRHSTAKQAASIAEQLEVDQLILGHYSARYDDLQPLLEEAKSVFEQSYLSHEGMTLDFHRES
jgi:ribonuclease Z